MDREKSTRRGALLAAVLLGLMGSADAALAAYPDWQALRDVKVIDVLTFDDDGDLRETKVWFVLVDGKPYLQTSNSRWLANLRRDPDLRLRIEGSEYQAHAEPVSGADLLEQIDTSRAEKYGWQHSLITFFRMGDPNLLRLSPLPGDEATPPSNPMKATP